MPTRLNPGLRLQPSSGLRTAVIIILAICVAAAFTPMLDAGWVYDDVNLVRPSPALQSLTGLGHSISTDLYSQAGSRLEVSPYWRPLAMASYWLDTRFGNAPGALHAGNILLHAIAAALLALVVMRRHGGMVGIIAAALASAWWALHPQNVEVVAWISCRYDILTGIALLGLLAMPWRPGALHAGVFGLVFLAGLFSKEGFAAMAAVVMVMDFADRRPVRDAAPRWMAVVLALLIWMGLRSLIGLKGLDLPPFESVLLIIFNYLEAISLYFWRAFTLPPLTISHPFIISGAFGVLAGVLILATLAAAAVLGCPPVPENAAGKQSRKSSAARQKTEARPEFTPIRSKLKKAMEGLFQQTAEGQPRRLAVPAAIFLAGLVPMAGAMTMFSEAPERYFYLPSIGLALLIGELLAFVMAMRHPLLRIAVPALAGVLIISGLILVERRLPDWKSDDALWSAALRVDPQDSQANYNLAISAGRRGDWDEARRAIEIASRGNPDSARIAITHAWVLLQTNDISGTVREARRATILAPYQPDGWYYLALGLHQAGDHAAELAAIDKLLEISPNFPRARQTREIAACEAECEAPGKCDCFGGR